MFSSGPNYPKLKTNLRLSISRLKLLQKKKSELTEKSRKEIADYIVAGKIERAKIRVEYIIREDYLVEALEVVEMYCDLLLARFGLISNMKELDDGIAEAVSSLIWVAPRLMSDVQELKVIADLLATKYGPQYAEACRIESVESISAKLKHKLSIQAPPKLLVEKYMIEIAKSYNVPYEPDAQIMATEKGHDALLIDLSTNNLGGGGMPQPPGFFGYPQPPPLPQFVNPMPPQPFTYPDQKGKELNIGPTAPPTPPFPYNIPPNGEKEVNTDIGEELPTYRHLYPNFATPKSEEKDDNASGDNTEKTDQENPKDLNLDVNLENSNTAPKPAPRSKLNDKVYDLPELPSVPNMDPSPEKDDIDFDDLSRRFNELKKKH
ncbi:IST1 homolog isoform X1 [Diabrotica virgifera virgifera]|uniref:IST1 homolog n=1 Tax=Diabrotica virgifera virgifera TaxID=50390 RepID=A0ABM5JWA4_DIAVI|nr:IST1 homolog isoform X1 [Diabrotica virgifera virgifera]